MSLVLPKSLQQLFNAQLRLEDTWKGYSQDPSLAAWAKLVRNEPATGDFIISVDSEPAEAMPEWLAARPTTEIDFRTWQHSIGRYGTSMDVDLDDVKPGSGRPEKMVAYQQKLAHLVEAAFLTPSQLFVRVIKAANALGAAALSVTATQWQPDGQNIFDSHPVKIGNSGLGTFRNYRSKDATGGGAAFPINVANEIAIIVAGLGFIAPNGINVPQMYNAVACAPSTAPALRRILHNPMLPVVEVDTGSSGGQVPNPVFHEYGGGGIEVVPVSGFPTTYRLYVDTTSDIKRSIGFQERQALTWQYEDPGTGRAFEFVEDNDSGVVGTNAFRHNKVSMGPKWRGAFYFKNWRAAFLADSQT